MSHHGGGGCPSGSHLFAEMDGWVGWEPPNEELEVEPVEVCYRI